MMTAATAHALKLADDDEEDDDDEWNAADTICRMNPSFIQINVVVSGGSTKRKKGGRKLLLTIHGVRLRESINE